MKNKALLYVILVSLAFIFITAGSFLTRFSTAQNQTGSASAYFSPDGGIRDRIISKINLSKKSIKVSIYSFTSGEIASSLRDAAKRGVDIKVVADEKESDSKHSEIAYLVSNGISVKRLRGKGRTGIMHNKFAIFDDKEVITGSYNWTNNAEYNNHENAVFLSDPSMVGQFIDEFNRLYNK